jgi:hypothetical protein
VAEAVQRPVAQRCAALLHHGPEALLAGASLQGHVAAVKDKGPVGGGRGLEVDVAGAEGDRSDLREKRGQHSLSVQNELFRMKPLRKAVLCIIGPHQFCQVSLMVIMIAMLV